MRYNIGNILSNKKDKVEKKSWSILENKNKIIFPEDYKWFIEHYGVGAINNFLWILSPFCQNANLNSIERFKIMKKAYYNIKSVSQNNCLFDFYDDGKGLFPWGITDNGDELYWNFNNGNVEIVIFASRYTDIKVYKMNTNEFLYDLLTKKIICNIFPDDFVLDNNCYVRIE